MFLHKLECSLTLQVRSRQRLAKALDQANQRWLPSSHPEFELNGGASFEDGQSLRKSAKLTTIEHRGDLQKPSVMIGTSSRMASAKVKGCV